MALVRPLVVGPLSTISTEIRVRGQLAGATVVVLSLGHLHRTVAKGVATTADERFAIDPAITLRPDDILYAIQELGADKSTQPQVGDPLGLPIQKAPTQTSALTSITFSSILYRCGQAVWLRGGVPGALADVRSGGAVIGSGPFLVRKEHVCS
jgi:hypothetical protein